MNQKFVAKNTKKKKANANKIEMNETKNILLAAEKKLMKI